MTLSFERHHQESTFHSPLESFQQVSVPVELREDPLTDHQARIVPQGFLFPDEVDIDEVVGDREGCFFCPEAVREATPEYPDWFGSKRGEVGEAVSFPNLNPYASYSNVIVLTRGHYRPLGKFTADVFANGFRAAVEYVGAVLEHDPETRHASINMNFLPPAGSSIVHPHMQMLIDDRGTREQR